MSDLTFSMGKFEAHFPTDRLYSQHHMWVQPVDGRAEMNSSDAQDCEAPTSLSGRRCRVGLTAYSVRLLQDVYFLDWALDPPATVARRQEIGEVESSKAVSSLYAPVAGELLAFNDALMQEPELLNTDHYGSGWLLEMTPQGELLQPAAYVRLLGEIWESTQRTLQGQANA